LDTIRRHFLLCVIGGAFCVAFGLWASIVNPTGISNAYTLPEFPFFGEILVVFGLYFLWKYLPPFAHWKGFLGYIKCPHCGSLVKEDGTVCKYCGKKLG
jgi:hypothetical protein